MPTAAVFNSFFDFVQSAQKQGRNSEKRRGGIVFRGTAANSRKTAQNFGDGRETARWGAAVTAPATG